MLAASPRRLIRRGPPQQHPPQQIQYQVQAQRQHWRLCQTRWQARAVLPLLQVYYQPLARGLAKRCMRARLDARFQHPMSRQPQ